MSTTSRQITSISSPAPSQPIRSFGELTTLPVNALSTYLGFTNDEEGFIRRKYPLIDNDPELMILNEQARDLYDSFYSFNEDDFEYVFKLLNQAQTGTFR